MSIGVPTSESTKQKVVALFEKGHTNQAIADGTTVRYIRGKFMQSGVAGDMVGMLVGVVTPKSTA